MSRRARSAIIRRRESDSRFSTLPPKASSAPARRCFVVGVVGESPPHGGTFSSPPLPGASRSDFGEEADAATAAAALRPYPPKKDIRLGGAVVVAVAAALLLVSATLVVAVVAAFRVGDAGSSVITTLPLTVVVASSLPAIMPGPLAAAALERRRPPAVSPWSRAGSPGDTVSTSVTAARTSSVFPATPACVHTNPTNPSWNLRSLRTCANRAAAAAANARDAAAAAGPNAARNGGAANARIQNVVAVVIADSHHTRATSELTHATKHARSVLGGCAHVTIFSTKSHDSAAAGAHLDAVAATHPPNFAATRRADASRSRRFAADASSLSRHASTPRRPTPARSREKSFHASVDDSVAMTHAQRTALAGIAAVRSECAHTSA